MKGRVLLAIAAFALLASGAAAEDNPTAIPKAEAEALRNEYILANTEFTVLHEIAHAAFREFDVPLFGREEDAADTLATMMMILHYGMDVDPRRMDRLLLVSSEWYEEWQVIDRREKMQPYWDEHSLSIQRFYNINCLLFGANEEMLGLSLDTELLPVERGWFCDQEFARARSAVRWLYTQHRRLPPDGGATPKPMIAFRFEEPSDDRIRRLYDLLRRERLLDNMVEQLNNLVAWPHPILISFENCGGSAEAHYNERVRSIFICGDLLEQFGEMADRQAAQGTDRLCRNPAIDRLFGDRLGCPSALAGSRDLLPSHGRK